ncbi:MAG: MMPL family transporter [bacterium]
MRGFAFIFLVALGIDYTIFLMARVREESRRHGTGSVLHEDTGENQQAEAAPPPGG